jgi:hypothetical protein
MTLLINQKSSSYISNSDAEVRDISARKNGIAVYEKLLKNPKPAPSAWKASCVNEECTLHQISPYIGKIKSVIANDLILSFSKPNDLIVDPFSGSGTIPLEAALLNRRVFASDISPYSKVISKAKLGPPKSFEDAIRKCNLYFKMMEGRKLPSLSQIPKWVKVFFHPRTLKEVLLFSEICREQENDFLLSCLLGILHHQRPGFLSYPSSHLVPYLRSKLFPRDQHPDLYKYRDLRPRILAKIKRTFKRFDGFSAQSYWQYRKSAIENISLPPNFNLLITSPPYMNALDYGRDNRLRLWFINHEENKKVDNPVTKEKEAFSIAMTSLAKQVEYKLLPGGHCVFIIGDKVSRSYKAHPSEIVCKIVERHSPSLNLISIIKDDIPDVRRSRKEGRATKSEHILIFRKKSK